MSRSSSRHLEEIGFLIAAIGGIAFLIAGILGIMEFSRGSERGFVTLGGILLAVGMVLAVVAVHGGF